jgi:HK97 family phage prohead protease
MSNIAQNFTETQYKAMPGQVSTDEMQGIVECFVAGIGNKDSVGDICLPGAFNASLKRRKPRVVWGHNWNEPIGKVLDIYEVGPKDPRLPAKMRAQNIGGLFAKVQFNLKSERGREAFSNVSFFGEEQEWSIGYKTLDAVFDTNRQANLLKEVELYEVSPVLHGANQLTATISIKSEDQLMETQDSSSEVEEKGSPLRDPKGGLTAAGRAHFKRTEGANLKPGVKGPADTPTKMRRKGSFLTRFFTNPRGPMKDEKGRPTRLALSAAAWGEPVPQDASDAAKLAAKGRRMLERYENSKKSDEAEVEEKNYAIYSAMNEQENPITGKMGMLARHLGRHFGGNITVREADENMVIFDIDRDGKPETMRAAYHSPEPDVFMFGASKPVRAQVVYVPMDDNGNRRMMTPGMDARPQYDIPRAGISQKPHGDCGCGCKGGDSCEIGAEMKSWSDYKNDTPGIHMFIKTVDMDMFAAVNEVADDYGFDVELLNDGFVIPNIDWHGSDAQNEVIGVLEGVSEKGLARGLRRGLAGAARRGMPSRDGDSDGKITNPLTGRDDLPAPRKPKMMPPREIPKEVPEKQPQTVPTRTPSRPTVPSRPVPSTPSRPAPTRPLVPAGRGSVAGQMGNRKNREALGRHILRQLREYELDISAPSKAPKRAMEMALDEIAQRNAMTRKQLDKILRRLIMQERRDAVLRRSGRMKSEETPNIYVSISEISDLEVKSGLQINSRDIDTLLIDAEPEMMFAVKSAVDAIGDFYGFESFATDAGIQIKDASYLPGDAIEAIANAYMNVAGEYDLVDFELNRLAK